jgi:hypothetical protein
MRVFSPRVVTSGRATDTAAPNPPAYRGRGLVWTSLLEGVEYKRTPNPNGGENTMKINPQLVGLLALAGAVVAIERFYEHPTYGRGIQALAAVLQAAAAF